MMSGTVKINVVGQQLLMEGRRADPFGQDGNTEGMDLLRGVEI